MNTQDETGQAGEPINYCPQCNSSYNLAKKFCGKCGIPLVAGTYSPTNDSNIPEQNASPDSVIQEHPKPSSQPASNAGSKSVIMPVVIVVCLSVVGYFGYGHFVAKKGAGFNLLSSESPASVSKGIITNVYDATSRGDIDGMLTNYAERVQYLSSGVVDKSFIARDARAYRKRWKYVKYEMVGDPTINTASEANTINAENEQRFQVQNSKKQSLELLGIIGPFEKTVIDGS